MIKEPGIFEELKYIHDDALLSVPSIADMVGVSPETVRRWIRSGKLPIHAPTGRYKVRCADLSLFLNRMYHKKTKIATSL
ncbi:helix-turn-helix domain-containing protein [Rummeliibacillus sp. JY-2-4R]